MCPSEQDVVLFPLTNVDTYGIQYKYRTHVPREKKPNPENPSG